MFNGVVVSFETNINSKQKKEVKTLIGDNGGSVNDFVNAKVCLINYYYTQYYKV